jgi:hypothetical protein
VLSLPPAFVLSQDQTLKLNEILISDWSLQQNPQDPKVQESAVFLTSSKHIRLMLRQPQTASRRSKAPYTRRDEFLET